MMARLMLLVIWLMSGASLAWAVEPQSQPPVRDVAQPKQDAEHQQRVVSHQQRLKAHLEDWQRCLDKHPSRASADRTLPPGMYLPGEVDDSCRGQREAYLKEHAHGRYDLGLKE